MTALCVGCSIIKKNNNTDGVSTRNTIIPVKFKSIYTARCGMQVLMRENYLVMCNLYRASPFIFICLIHTYISHNYKNSYIYIYIICIILISVVICSIYMCVYIYSYMSLILKYVYILLYVSYT